MKTVNWSWQSQRENYIKGLKIAIATVLSIMAADLLHLSYYATAGIITILSIQNTKQETILTARNRTLAFLAALLIAWACFQISGYTFLAFALYILLFSTVCLVFRWPEAIAMDSVLITHFLGEQSMALPLLLNEILLFTIGTFFGIFMNLHLHRDESAFWQVADQVDEEIKGVLSRMTQWLLKEDKSGYNRECFRKLEHSIQQAEDIAWKNLKNSFFQQSRYEKEYITMRREQMEVLRRIQDSILMLPCVPSQAIHISGLFQQVVLEYHRDNDISKLLADLQNVLLLMKQEELPRERQEFESRAVLYYILMQLREFLQLKRDFILRYEKGYESQF